MKLLCRIMITSLHLAFLASAAPVPYRVGFSGLLTDQTGNPVSNSVIQVTASLFNQVTGGSVLYIEPVATVTTALDGTYSFSFGSSTNTFKQALESSDVWLQVTINNTNVLSPRTRLLAVPYALRAANGVVDDKIVFSDGSMLYYDGYDLLFSSKGILRQVQLVAFSSNLPPVAANDAFTVLTNQSTQLSVLSNDSDPNTTDTLLILTNSIPTNSSGTVVGSLAINQSGTSFTYTATPATGTVYFTYFITDMRGGVATGRVSVAVLSAPPTPSNMVLIAVPPEGTMFKMGYPKPVGAVQAHMPEHYVKITRSFYMDKYEVTKAHWDEIFNWAIANGYKFEGCIAAGNGPNHPVYRVTWFDAAKWCNAKSEMMGLTPVYYTNADKTQVFREGKTYISPDKCKKTANGYRLPTEAEWEFAATGVSLPGQNGEEDYHPWDETSGQPSSLAVMNTSSTAPVGSKNPGNHGLYDMAGNVYEWCFEVPYKYSSSTANNPQVDPWQPSKVADFVSPAGNYRHMARGGSFLSNELRANSWRRIDMYEQWARFRSPLDKQFGFRTVITAP